MTHTLRHTAAGIVVLGVWGWLPNQAFAQTTPVRMMRVLILNTAGAPAAVLSEAEKAAARCSRPPGSRRPGATLARAHQCPKLSRTLTIARAEVYSDEGKHVASMQQTLMMLANTPDTRE